MLFSSPFGSHLNGSNDLAFRLMIEISRAKKRPSSVGRLSFSLLIPFYFMSLPLLIIDKRLAESEWFLGRMSRVAFRVCMPSWVTAPVHNAILLCTPPSLSQVTSVPHCVLLLHLHGAWFKLPHTTVVVCEPTFVLLECLPVKVSLRLRHLSTKSNSSCSVPSGQFRTNV